MGILTGIAAGAQAIGGLMQRRSEKKAAKTQFERTKELQDRAHGQQKEMWDYTNYPNQVKMMQEAGLNPALMYGQGGGGGTTAGSGNMGSVSQEQVSNVGANAAQAAMMMSQIELTKAQTKKTEAEAENIEGVERGLKEAQTGNIQADTKLRLIQEKADNLNLEFQDRTLDSRVQAIYSQGDKLLQEAQQLRNQTNISNATWQEEVKQIKQKTIQAMLDAEATKMGTTLDKAKINEVTANITYMAEATRLTGEGQVITRENMEKLTKAMLWSAGINATGQIINNVVDIATRPVKAGTEVIETVTKGKNGGVKKVNTTTKTQY